MPSNITVSLNDEVVKTFKTSEGAAAARFARHLGFIHGAEKVVFQKHLFKEDWGTCCICGEPLTVATQDEQLLHYRMRFSAVVHPDESQCLWQVIRVSSQLLVGRTQERAEKVLASMERFLDKEEAIN